MKTEEHIFEEIAELITARLGVDNNIKPDDNLVTDLGADSLDTVELIMDIEHKYGVSLSEKESAQIKTVRDIVSYITDATNKK